MNTTQLIYRVLSGDASPEEKLQLEQWRALSDANRIEYEDIKTLWECSRDTETKDLSDEEFKRGWKQIKQRMLAIQQRRRRVRVIIVILILVFVLGTIGWLAYYLGKQEKPSLHGQSAVVTSGVYHC
jgi:transmembrane sensor